MKWDPKRGAAVLHATRLDHGWELTPKEAMALQEQLRSRVEREDRLGPVRRIAGVDVGFEEGGAVARAAVAVLSWPGLAPLEDAVVRTPTVFPYVPGLLSFREAPAVLQALGELSAPPDLILYDGQGIAHPRRLGVASHVGLLADIPTIGVAKTRLTGTSAEPPQDKGGWTPLMDGDEPIGAVLRTRAGIKPLYVSTGHRVSLATAIGWVMACVTRYRLPETTRRAHHLASG